MVELDLQSNGLADIPCSILELPRLVNLNLSNNCLTSLPDLPPKWSSERADLDNSYIRITNTPGKPFAPSILTLNLADNDFHVVPQCICHMHTLMSLDLSNNKNITSLPLKMGNLRELKTLSLSGLKNLKDPPKNFHREPIRCIQYLRGKLMSTKAFYRMKMVVLGKHSQGKTTLVAHLLGRDCGNESTVGVNISEWEYRPGLADRKFTFSIWDFGGQEVQYATHQCFLSEHSMYLVLFNLKHGDAGVKELTPWLNNIALRAPMSPVLIVGTHLDEIPDHEKKETVDSLLHQTTELVAAFHTKLKITKMFAVGLKNHLLGVREFKDAIYQCAAEYTVGTTGKGIMGQQVPSSYHALDKHIRGLQKEVWSGTHEPIMRKEEFMSIICQLNITDIEEEDDLRAVTRFLHNVGTILHYDDLSHHLNELYFIDPRWLCDMVTKIVTMKERDRFAKGGIMHTNSIPFQNLFRQFPWKYHVQLLTILDHFENAIVLDKYHILIPSRLPEARPIGIDITEVDGEPLYTRQVFFTHSSPASLGFWSRLISLLMYFIPQVWYTLMTISELKRISHMDSVQLERSISISTADKFAYFTGDEEGVFSAHHTAPPTIFDHLEATLMYWRTGLFYHDQTVCFRVESLSTSMSGPCKKEGVVISTSPSPIGVKIIGQVLDLVTALVNNWYTDMQPNQGHLEQAVLCGECVKMKRSEPYWFDVQDCHTLIGQNVTTIDCGYNHGDGAMNHTLSLARVVPDLLLQDMNATLLLDYSELENQKLLGRGGFANVHQGWCRDQSVALKRYFINDSYGKMELRSEATLLQKAHHPSLVGLVGVCVNPPILVLEEAPMGSLEQLQIKQRKPIHRMVIHRIAAQVAAALRFLHNNGIIYRDVKAGNVLLWSLDPESLCHCKLTDFGTSTHLTPVGVRGLIGTKGFIAPETLHIVKQMGCSSYNHKADIFSFGMLLYQMISCRHPFHDMQADKTDLAIEKGERPILHDCPQAEYAYFYLTKLMQCCWLDDPRLRPTTTEIISKVSLCSFQSVMAIQPVRSKLSLRNACAIASTHLIKGNISHGENELWVCCDGAEGTEVITYTTNTMTMVDRNLIEDKQVQCISVCGDHIWVATIGGMKDGEIHIFSTHTRHLIHSIQLKDSLVTCMACSDIMVFCGTLEGFCLSFNMDIKQLQFHSTPCRTYVSENTVDGIVVTKDSLWLSHTNNISFFNPQTLAMDGSPSLCQAECIGQLKMSADESIVWSAYFGGISVSAWSASQRCHLFDVDIRKQMEMVGSSSEHDMIITSMTPALDTVWVGLAGGYILVLKEELLMWFCPYEEPVRFLVCIHCGGPCHTEKAMVMSGAKVLRSPMIPGLFDRDDDGIPVDKAGTLVVWEAYPSKMCKQIFMMQSQSSTYLDSHQTVREMVEKGGFKDGTCLLDGEVQNRKTVDDVEAQKIKLSSHACVVTTSLLNVSSHGENEVMTHGDELWVCYDGAEGTEIITYATNTMTMVGRNLIKDKQVQCISLCGDHVWVATKVGMKDGEIHIFSTHTRDLIHSIQLKDSLVSCMACSEIMVFCGTLEGFCLSFKLDIKQLQFHSTPCHTYVSENAVDGIVVTKDSLWLSHTNNISFFNLQTLAIDGSPSQCQAECIGQLKMSADESIVWSAHIGGVIVSAWSVSQRDHLFDVDIRRQMEMVGSSSEHDMIITSMTPALDTVWIGLTGGYILVLKEELLMWFCPYKEPVRFLVCIHCGGPCHTEKAMVMSGAKVLRSPMIPGLFDHDDVNENGIPVDKAETLVVWEAYPSKMCKQIFMMQSQSSTYLDSHQTVREMVEKDGLDCTCLLDSEVQNRKTVDDVEAQKIKLSSHACVVTTSFLNVSSHGENEVMTHRDELWVCCDGAEGTEIITCTTNTMTMVGRSLIEDNQVQCISVCGDHVWVATKVGMKDGVIHIFSPLTRDLIHSIQVKGNTITCMAHSDTMVMVYCGTQEGSCLSFNMDIKQLQFCSTPRCTYLSENAVDGIVVTKDSVWLSHTNNISFVNPQTLAMKGSPSLCQAEFIGQLKMSADESIVWSGHIGGMSVSAWSVSERCHLFDVDIRKQMEMVVPSCEHDMIITSMTPALDTVWVGLAGGYILVLKEELLMWFSQYKKPVRFLVCIHCGDKHQTDKAMMVSGAEGLKCSMMLDYNLGEKDEPEEEAGILILWNVFPSNLCKKISVKSITSLNCHLQAAIERNNPRIEDQFKNVGECTNMTDGASLPAVLPNMTEAAFVDNERDLNRQISLTSEPEHSYSQSDTFTENMERPP